MSFKKTDLQFINERIIEATNKADNEEDLKFGIESALKNFFKQYEIELEPKYEKSVFRGRIDALYGFLIIEYEAPRVMNTDSKKNHAIDQVKEYIEKLATEHKVEKKSLLGVAIDGENLVYVKWRDNWVVSRMYKINMQSLPQFLESFRGLYREPLTSKSLTDNLGFKTKLCKDMMKALIDSLKNREKTKTGVLFTEWKKFYSESCGYDFNNPKKLIIDFAAKFNLNKDETSECIFCLQTYFSLITVFIASEIVSLKTIAAFEGYLEYLINCNQEELYTNLINMSEGGIFENFGINNFLEGDFFWWFVEEWNDDLESSVRGILNILNQYEPASSTAYSGNIEDILKELYENLIPRGVRHDLGEFYTANWIAEYILNRMKFKKNVRVLDPTCGSGTFLMQSIHKYISLYSSSLEESELLENITKSFVGIDLNPIAIITARTNYLLAIKDLISFSKGPLFIPIYLADSIASTKKRTITGNSYIMITTVGNFEIPTVFIDSEYRMEFYQILEESIRHESDFNNFKERLKKYFAEEELPTLSNLYTKFIKLEKEGKNRIWARLLVNTFAPFTIGKFDYVIGNPPWIAWENLPKGYRKNTQSLWKKYYLFSIRKGSEAQLGGGKKDIAMLFVHRSIDFYLKEKGELIFLITQTVFQSVKTGEGFRKFKISSSGYFKVTKIDDINKLKAFHATNKAAIIYCKKGEKTEYPIKYYIWEKRERINLADNSLSYSTVRDKVLIKRYLAIPSTKKEGSRWITYPASSRQFPKIMEKLSGTSQYMGKAGVTTWLNGVYFVKILKKYSDGQVLIENLNTIGRKKVQLIRAKIEPDLLYPLIRGRDVDMWAAKPQENIYILITNDPATRNPILLSRMKTKFPNTYNYLLKFKDDLEGRSGYKKFFKRNHPFYAIYNVEKKLFAPFRLLWSEMGDFGCAVVEKIDDLFLGKKLPVTNNKNMYIPFNDESEAYFITSILNFQEVREYIESKKLTTSTSTKLVAEMKIPEFDAENEIHKKIVKLAKKINNNYEQSQSEIRTLNDLLTQIFDLA